MESSKKTVLSLFNYHIWLYKMLTHAWGTNHRDPEQYKNYVHLISMSQTYLCHWRTYPKGRKFSLEFKFFYFANDNIAKFRFRFLIRFLQSFNLGLTQLKLKIRSLLIFHSVNLTFLRQVVKLYPVYLFVHYDYDKTDFHNKLFPAVKTKIP